VAACTEPVLEKWEDDLASAEARWRDAGIADYEMDVLRHCFCVPAQIRPVTVTVRGGAFVSLVYADSAAGVADTTYFREYLTMERIFALLHKVLDSGPDGFSADYHGSLGYPTLVGIDPDHGLANEEFTIGVFALRPQGSAAR
jgi:hypothetical protein